MKLRSEQQTQAIEMMKTLKLFAGCSPTQLQMVAVLLEAQNFAKTKVIIMEQEISRTLYLLVQGTVGKEMWKKFRRSARLRLKARSSHPTMPHPMKYPMPYPICYLRR
jgi:hypothetical protein